MDVTEAGNPPLLGRPKQAAALALVTAAGVGARSHAAELSVNVPLI